MIKLKYKPTYTFSSLDIFDYADTEPIIYEAYARQSGDFAALTLAWEKDNWQSVDIALDIIASGLVSVSQGGQTYPLNGREGAEALQAAIEADNPGYGETFIKHLALGFYRLHFRRSEEHLGNSEGPSARSAGGNGRGKLKGQTAKVKT